MFKARAAIGRTVETLAGADSILKFLFLSYDNRFLLITHAASSGQELAADRPGADIVGGAAIAKGLKGNHVTARCGSGNPLTGPYVWSRTSISSRSTGGRASGSGSTSGMTHMQGTFRDATLIFARS